MIKNGILIIVSGPSGSGKGTVVEELVKEENFSLSISVTTRNPRSYEHDGQHYFFYSKEKFQDMIKTNQLLEWACFCGNFYGTPKSYVETQLSQGKHVILEIEVQGAEKVKEIYPESVLIFMLPPSLEELKLRLIGRGTEDECTVSKRLERALEEIELAKNYDYVLVNDTVEQAKEDLKAIVHAEWLKYSRNNQILKLFKGER